MDPLFDYLDSKFNNSGLPSNEATLLLAMANKEIRAGCGLTNSSVQGHLNTSCIIQSYGGSGFIRQFKITETEASAMRKALDVVTRVNGEVSKQPIHRLYQLMNSNYGRVTL